MTLQKLLVPFFLSLSCASGTSVSFPEVADPPPTVSPAPSASQAPSQAPTLPYEDYFSPECSAFAQITNDLLEKIGLSNPFSYYNCITENLAEAFQQSGFCVTDDIENIITNSSDTRNCTSFQTIFDLVDEIGADNITDDEIRVIAVTIFDSTVETVGTVIVEDSSDFFNQSALLLDFHNTTDFDIYGCYTQNVTEEYSDDVIYYISDPTCIEARVTQTAETIAFYELVQEYNARLRTYIVIGSGIAFALLLVCGGLLLQITSAGIGKEERMPR